MKLQFKQQQFQIDAVNAVCDIFAGQPMAEPFRYILDPGRDVGMLNFEQNAFANNPIALAKSDIWDVIHKKQAALGLKPSGGTSDDINLTVEMETGTGKTYTYIKTMYELNKRYGWSKFIIIVPSIAIREGVKKFFEITREHFKQEYGKSIIEFIYNSGNLTEIEIFATDSKIRAMIINSQAFATSLKEDGRSKESRIIFSEQDSFRGRRPIDVIAKTNPILILDEPQSLGRTADSATQKALKLFNALFSLRYSATPPELNKNIIYRLDAQDAYNKKLVKKISVKGISVSGDSATGGYVYLVGLNLSVGKSPTAKLEFDMRGASNIRKTTRICKEGDNLYNLSNNLDEYKTGWLIISIDGRTNSVRFQNGKEIFAGEVIGSTNDEQLRRIQIREAIASHFEREQALFNSGIKVLSLFFIDEVAKYRLSDDGLSANGIYAKIFEEEYNAAKNDLVGNLELWPEYQKFLREADAASAHRGYFSIDKKSGKFKDSDIKRGSFGSDDIDAYNLIMKSKERLLDRANPVRFIFSHSALREGWDNPNVFQICTLKQSTNDTSRRQEIGRGLRLSVNQNGERMDENFLGEDVQNVNVLTVITGESYEKFVEGLQKDIAAAMSDRLGEVSVALFEGQIVDGTPIAREKAQDIYEGLIENGYVKHGVLTEKYHEDVETKKFMAPGGFRAEDIISLINTIYKPMKPENARDNVVELKLDEEKFRRKEFQALWKQINVKSSYSVFFETDELIEKSIATLDSNLRVTKMTAIIKTGAMDKIESKQVLEEGVAFSGTSVCRETINARAITGVKYDLIDKLVRGTGLTRSTLVKIMQGIQASVFEQFSQNPEEFIMQASKIINEQKTTTIIEHIEYNRLDSSYSTDIFTEPTIRGALENSVETPNKHIYSHIIADSGSRPEKEFATTLDISEDVAVYAKLPRGFYISTPVGKYSPDLAIAFNEGTVKHIYFVAETKGTMDTLELRGVENAKIACARKHFKAISSDNVKYDVVKDYASLLRIIGK
jgi:type III restriction enzyme